MFPHQHSNFPVNLQSPPPPHSPTRSYVSGICPLPQAPTPLIIAYTRIVNGQTEHSISEVGGPQLLMELVRLVNCNDV